MTPPEPWTPGNGFRILLFTTIISILLAASPDIRSAALFLLQHAAVLLCLILGAGGALVLMAGLKVPPR